MVQYNSFNKTNNQYVISDLSVALAVLTDQVWDPLSSSQTSRLVAFMHRVIKDYPTVLHGDNRNTQVRDQMCNICFWSDIQIPPPNY